MRKIVILSFGITAVFLLAGCAGKAPQLTVDNQVDFGDIVNGEILTQNLTVRNDGDGELIVEAVSTSCGCTSATLEPMTIPPGGTGMLHLEFDSGAHGPDENGELLRQVFIASNDPDNPETVVEIRANVLPRP